MFADNPESLVKTICRIPPFAHHPTCSCFDQHVIRVGGAALCLGCVSMASGLILGSVGLLVASQIDPQLILTFGCVRLVAIGTACYIPTVLQLFLQNKYFKILSRALLGVGVVLLWFGAIVLLPSTPSGMLLRVVFVVAFLGVGAATLALRKRRSREIWQTCKYGGFPFCAENLHRCRQSLLDFKENSTGSDRMLAALLVSAMSTDSVGVVVEFSQSKEAVSVFDTHSDPETTVTRG